MIQRNANHRDVARFVPCLPNPYTARDARMWINHCFLVARRGGEYQFGIEDKVSRCIIGMIGLHRVNRTDRNAEVGYWLGRRYWNRGFVTEALRLIAQYSFGSLKLVRVYAIVLDTNTASIRALEKTGFVRESVMRQASFHGRRWHNVYGYGLLAKEFRR